MEHDEKMKNGQYAAGYEIGYRRGEIKEMTRLINTLDKDLIYVKDEELCDMIARILIDASEAHENWGLVEGTLSRKEIKFFLLGYVDGKVKGVNTRKTTKYQEKVGIIAKSYKLPGQLTANFAIACSKNGTNQTAVLKKFMEDYISTDVE